MVVMYNMSIAGVRVVEFGTKSRQISKAFQLHPDKLQIVVQNAKQ